MRYEHTLSRLENPPPLLADYPAFLAPLEHEVRYLAPPMVVEAGGDLLVRSWRYWYNVRGIVEFENRLCGEATAVIVVHPCGVDDGHGLQTPEPAGVVFFCTPGKNEVARHHMRRVLNPFLSRLRPRVGLVGYSLPGKEDDIRKLLYRSPSGSPSPAEVARGEELLREFLSHRTFRGEALPSRLTLDDKVPVSSYLDQTPSTDAGERYNGPGYWDLPLPVATDVARDPADVVFYDADGYASVRSFLKEQGIRHVLLAGYATDMCVARTTCGYENLGGDFNLFLVGDATLATFPGSTTPRYATQVAVANAALRQLITQTSWVRPPAGERQ